MAHTIKAEPFKPYRKEKAPARRLTAQQFRARTRQALRSIMAGRDEESMAFPVKRGTCGWLTY